MHISICCLISEGSNVGATEGGKFQSKNRPSQLSPQNSFDESHT